MCFPRDLLWLGKFRQTVGRGRLVLKFVERKSPILGWRVHSCDLTANFGLSSGIQDMMESFNERKWAVVRHVAEFPKIKRRATRQNGTSLRRVPKLKARAARVRDHWAHGITTDTSPNYGGVLVEALCTRHLTRVAGVTLAEPVRNVAQKRGLNRLILNVGWYQLETMLAQRPARSLKSIRPIRPRAILHTEASQSRVGAAITSRLFHPKLPNHCGRPIVITNER